MQTVEKNNEEVYDDWSEWYPYLYGSFDAGVDYFHRTVGKTLLTFLSEGSILDAGCGIGMSSGGLLKAGYRTTGVDLSTRSIEKCRSMATEYGDIADFRVGDLLRMPETIGPFDGIVALTAIIPPLSHETGSSTVLGADVASA